MSAPVLSLNELSFFFTRAAVGAGAPFGIGEDLAEAVKALAALGGDICALSLPALEGLEAGSSSEELSVSGGADAWEISGNGVISALYAGPVAADAALVMQAEGRSGRVLLRQVDCPALVYGCLVAAGLPAFRLRRVQEGLCAGMAGGEAVFAPGRQACFGLSGPADLELLLEPASAPEGERVALAEGRSRVLQEGVAVSDAGWAGLYGFFHKCLVPSTAESRESGAGAGLTDND